MKKSSIILIITVAVVAILAIWAVKARGSSSTFKQDFHIANTSTITKVFLADKQNHSVTLTRQADRVVNQYSNATNKDGEWLVDNQWAANQAFVDGMLDILNDMRIREQVNKSAANNVLKAMAAKSIKIEVYQRVYRINWFKGRLRLFPHEKFTRTYYLGDETQDMMGSYMYREGDKMPYIIHIPHFRGFIAPASFSTDPILWRSHRIVDLPVQQIERVELEIPAAPQESFAIVRQGEGFVMQMLHPAATVNGFDTARVAQLLSSFVNLNFDEYATVVPKVELDSTFSKRPRTILTIRDTKGKETQLKTFTKYKNPDDVKKMPDTTMYQVFDLDRLYAVMNQKDTVLIQYYIFDNILQPASFFRGGDITTFAKHE